MGTTNPLRAVKLAAVSLNQTPRAWLNNKRNIVQGIAKAKAEGASVIVLPELCTTGYGCEDSFTFPATNRRAAKMLREVLPETKGTIVFIGLPMKYKGANYNCAAVAVDGELKGFVAKQFLPGDRLFYEGRWFKPWPQGQVGEVEFDQKRYPIGDIYFEVASPCMEPIRIGCEICHDAWVGNRPGRQLASQAIDIIAGPNASPFSIGKYRTRQHFTQDASRAFNCAVVYCNLMGNEAGPLIFDGGNIIASGGKIFRLGKRFSFQEMSLTTAVVDIEANRMNLAAEASFRPDMGEDPRLQRVDLTDKSNPFLGRNHKYVGPNPKPDDEWEMRPEEDLKYEEIIRAVALGLFDYVRKSKCWGLTWSLSGGADSTLVGALCYDMPHLAVAELGFDGFKEALSHIGWLGNCSSLDDVIPRLLQCAYQSTANSSEETRESAVKFAKAIGAHFSIFEIDEQVVASKAHAEAHLGRKLTWETDDVSLQNNQARVRAPNIWFLANIARHLLLMTGNMTEALVGYSTQDGDTAGGLAPIFGLIKPDVLDCLKWREKNAPLGLLALEALSFVNALIPSAELRPLDQGQTDENDLAPYPVLGVIEREFINCGLDPVEMFDRLRDVFDGQYSDELFHTWVKRVYTLFSQNAWKRERSPVTFHLSDHNLSPRLALRYPVLSGCFEDELNELAAYVAALTE